MLPVDVFTTLAHRPSISTPPPTTTYAKPDTSVSSDTKSPCPSWTTMLITKSYTHIPLHSQCPGALLIYNLNNSLSDTYGTPHSHQPTLPPMYHTPTPNAHITSLLSPSACITSLLSSDYDQYLHDYYTADLPSSTFPMLIL